MNYGRRVARAVQDEDWQTFRAKLKGLDTSTKLDMLEKYYDEQLPDEREAISERELEDIKIRIDNYIKALCRGGQLEAGMTFDHFFDGSIRNHIRK